MSKPELLTKEQIIQQFPPRAETFPLGERTIFAEVSRNSDGELFMSYQDLLLHLLLKLNNKANKSKWLKK